MSTKMKGICKGFKLISQIFVVKEHEMEIGHPTDVKHVAHIGWDGPSGSNPSWMDDFKTSPDFASKPIGLGESVEKQPESPEINGEEPSSELQAIPKKHRRKKKNKATSSPRSVSSSRSSRAARSKTKLVEESQT